MRTLIITLLGTLFTVVLMLASASILTGVGLLLGISGGRVVGAIILILFGELLLGIKMTIKEIRGLK